MHESSATCTSAGISAICRSRSEWLGSSQRICLLSGRKEQPCYFGPIIINLPEEMKENMKKKNPYGTLCPSIPIKTLPWWSKLVRRRRRQRTSSSHSSHSYSSHTCIAGERKGTFEEGCLPAPCAYIKKNRMIPLYLVICLWIHYRMALCKGTFRAQEQGTPVFGIVLCQISGLL